MNDFESIQYICQCYHSSRQKSHEKYLFYITYVYQYEFWSKRILCLFFVNVFWHFEISATTIQFQFTNICIHCKWLCRSVYDRRIEPIWYFTTYSYRRKTIELTCFCSVDFWANVRHHSLLSRNILLTNLLATKQGKWVLLICFRRIWWVNELNSIDIYMIRISTKWAM